jgi:hypothetical protein
LFRELQRESVQDSSGLLKVWVMVVVHDDRRIVTGWHESAEEEDS